LTASTRRTAATPPPRTTGSTPRPRLLYVDDDPLLASIGKLALARAGYEVDIAGDGVSAWEAMNRVAYHLLVTDNDMPGLTGVELIALARCAGMRLPIVMASGSCAGISDSSDAGSKPLAFLPKPFVLETLLETVDLLLRTSNERGRHWGINE
jgi:DNA-binding response OmpR family regulator